MTITYSEIQRIYRAEKRTPALCKIDKNFYRDVSELISQVEEEHRKSIRKMVEDIYIRRRNKILMQVMRTFDTEPMNALPSEKRLYWDIVDLLKRFEIEIEEKPAEVKRGEKKDKEIASVIDRKEREDTRISKIRLRILKAIPSIIGSDTNRYGPFEAGDEAEIPIKTARILVECGVAEEI